MSNEEENYSPYCKACGACGEDGCCSALRCKHSKDGEYCEGYLTDLQFAYKMYRDTYDYLKDDEDSKKKLEEIWRKNWDLFYKNTPKVKIEAGDTVQVYCQTITEHKFTEKVKEINGDWVIFENNKGKIQKWYCTKVV